MEKKKTKKSSVATLFIAVLVVIALVATMANLMNYTAIMEMGTNIDQIAEVGMTNTELVNDVKCTIESVQKDFYAYSSTGSKTDAHAKFSAAYTEDAAALDELLNQMASTGWSAQVEGLRANLDIMYENMAKIMKFADMEDEVSDAVLVAAQKVSGMNAIQRVIAEMNTSLDELAVACNNQTNQEIQAAEALQKQMLIVGIIMIVITLLISVAGGFFAYARIAKPLKKSSKELNGIIEDIRAGQGDLTKHIQYAKNDEIGMMVGGFNEFVDVLKEMIEKIKDGSYQLEEAAGSVNQGVREAGSKIGDTSMIMQQLTANMQEASASMEKISGNISQIGREISQMADQTAEGLDYVDDIKGRADALMGSAKNSQNEANEIVEKISGGLAEAIEQSKSVEKINELTDEILSISSQTNLLALNASIEAARAGEAGKGFAVVADEIRKLADESRNTANGIQEISATVIQSVDALAKNAQSMLTFVNEDVLEAYKNMVQTGVTYHEDANQMNQMMQNLRNATEELRKAAEEITTVSSGITEVVSQSAIEIESAAGYTMDVERNMQVINASVEQNLVIADSLMDEVKDFKCE